MGALGVGARVRSDRCGRRSVGAVNRCDATAPYGGTQLMSRYVNGVRALRKTRGWPMATAAAIAWVLPGSAAAASLSGPVSGWNSGVPSYISMYEYVPATLAASPPVLVAAHYCGG